MWSIGTRRSGIGDGVAFGNPNAVRAAVLGSANRPARQPTICRLVAATSMVSQCWPMPAEFSAIVLNQLRSESVCHRFIGLKTQPVETTAEVWRCAGAAGDALKSERIFHRSRPAAKRWVGPQPRATAQRDAGWSKSGPSPRSGASQAPVSNRTSRRRLARRFRVSPPHPDAHRRERFASSSKLLATLTDENGEPCEGAHFRTEGAHPK